MLLTARPIMDAMVGRVLHWVSVTCCAFLFISFVLFAHSQLSSASTHQAGLIAPPKSLASSTPTGALGLTTQPVKQQAPPPKPKGTGQPRKFIDSVARKLESPFTSLVSTNNAWVKHLVPFILSLLMYGVGIGFLSRWTAGLAS